MPSYIVRIQVIKVYDVRIDAKNERKAIEKIEAMQSSEIQETGSLQDVTTEFPEIMSKESKE